MKPFLGIDLTQNKKNQEANGREFLVQELSAAMSQSLEASAEKADKTLEKAKLPLPLRIVQYVCGLGGLIILAGIFKADVSLAEGYQNAPGLYWTAGICLVVWLTLWLWGRQKGKAVLGTDESTQTLSHLEGVSNASYAELGVPSDAKDVDVLTFFYKVKDEQIKICEQAFQVFQYLNLEYKLFADAEHLYLSSLSEKYAFPLTSVTAIRTEKKHIRMAGWNKDEAHNKGIYKAYKLTSDDYGCIHCKSYHILEINHNGTLWGIYFPSYELPAFETVTGRKAQMDT